MVGVVRALTVVHLFSTPYSRLIELGLPLPVSWGKDLQMVLTSAVREPAEPHSAPPTSKSGPFLSHGTGPESPASEI